MRSTQPHRLKHTLMPRSKQPGTLATLVVWMTPETGGRRRRTRTSGGDNRMGVPPGDGDATEADDKGYDTAASKEGVSNSSRGKRTAKPSSATEKKDGAGVVNLDDDTHEL